jgi:2-dehydro-3-deoxygluconokinase
MKNIVVLGECMVEFSPDVQEGSFKQSFAGEVYNTAVYLKRLLKESTEVSILTAVGNDTMSDLMVDDFLSNSIDTSLVKRVNDRQAGAYLILTTAQGERSFVYWRDTSAAKVTISELSEKDRSKLVNQCDLFYFSGISIAILDQNERESFWQLVSDLRNAGTQIVFDSNFRSRLWQSHDDAKQQFAQAFTFSNIVFAGVEDFFLLYTLDKFSSIDNFFNDYSIDELIIKNGADGVFYRSATEQFIVGINPVDNVIDTTSAGDSFNSAFINAKMKQSSAVEAVKEGCRLSACIIQHKGAIIDNQIFNDFLATQHNFN